MQYNITHTPTLSSQLIISAKAFGNWLYGDEAKTRRTFGLCILAIALGKVLDTAPTLAACGI